MSVIHQAGPEQPEDLIQKCALCGGILVDMRVPGRDMDRRLPRLTLRVGPYPEGAYVEKGQGWEAMALDATARPNCCDPKAPETGQV